MEDVKEEEADAADDDDNDVDNDAAEVVAMTGFI